jgi:hypothetical protein
MRCLGNMARWPGETREELKARLHNAEEGRPFKAQAPASNQIKPNQTCGG